MSSSCLFHLPLFSYCDVRRSLLEGAASLIRRRQSGNEIHLLRTDLSVWRYRKSKHPRGRHEFNQQTS